MFSKSELTDIKKYSKEFREENIEKIRRLKSKNSRTV